MKYKTIKNDKIIDYLYHQGIHPLVYSLGHDDALYVVDDEFNKALKDYYIRSTFFYDWREE